MMTLLRLLLFLLLIASLATSFINGHQLSAYQGSPYSVLSFYSLSEGSLMKDYFNENIHSFIRSRERKRRSHHLALHKTVLTEDNPSINNNNVSNSPVLVDVSLYVESLCPYCRALIVSVLADAVEEIGSIMSLHYYCFGNAKEKVIPSSNHGEEYKFICQHGKKECFGNYVQSCAVHHYPSSSDWFPFIYCLSAHDAVSSIQRCAEWANLDSKTIIDCANSDEGKQLVHEAGKKTAALNPPLNGVPWVVVDGSPLPNTDKLVATVCESFEKKNKNAKLPHACKEYKKQ